MWWGLFVSQQALFLPQKALARVDSELSSAEEELSIRELRRDTRYSVMNPTAGGKMNKVTLSIKETGKASGMLLFLVHTTAFISALLNFHMNDCISLLPFIINNGFKEDLEDSYGDRQSSLPSTYSFTKRNSTANDALNWVQAVDLQAYLQLIFVAMLYLR